MRTTSIITAAVVGLNVQAYVLFPELDLQYPLVGDDVHDIEASYLIETQPGETRWITEDQKWELRRVS